jgi:phosphatidylserine/phosphatidylglycerophosphate/cardiolipin synthase-like enzyme
LKENFFKLPIRGLIPIAAFLLVFAQIAAAGDPGPEPAASRKPAGCDLKLLVDRDYFPALREGIRHARQEIALSAFFFKTTGGRGSDPETILKDLLEAARRGVRVDVVFEMGPRGDNVSRDNERAARRLKKGGVYVCMDTPETTTHAKLVVIDRRFLFVGSHNLTQSALKYNHEVSVWIDSAPLAEETLRYMKSLCP